MAAPAHETPIALVEALVGLSSTDLAYADLYLHRAGEMLAPILSERQYALLGHERDRLAELAKELHEAIARNDWRQVHTLAALAARKRLLIADNTHLLALGDAVYAPRIFRCDPDGLAFAGMNRDAGPVPDAVRQSEAGHDRGAGNHQRRIEHLVSSTSCCPDSCSWCSGISTLPSSLVTALMPNAATPKWWRIDFQVSGQSGLTGGTSSTWATPQPVPLCMVLISLPSHGVRASLTERSRLDG
jgi:hypothetical protein